MYICIYIYIYGCLNESMMSHFSCRLFTGGKQQTQRSKYALYLCGSGPTTKHWTGLFPVGFSLEYRLSCAVLQKHLNLRWQECVQLISSTVAPSSGFLLHNTGHHRKSRANTLKHNRYRLRGAVPACPANCHYLLYCCESHPLLCTALCSQQSLHTMLDYKHTHRQDVYIYILTHSHTCVHICIYSWHWIWCVFILASELFSLVRAKWLDCLLLQCLGRMGTISKETLLSLAVSHSCPLTVHLKVH